MPLLKALGLVQNHMAAQPDAALLAALLLFS